MFQAQPTAKGHCLSGRNKMYSYHTYNSDSLLPARVHAFILTLILTIKSVVIDTVMAVIETALRSSAVGTYPESLDKPKQCVPPGT